MTCSNEQFNGNDDNKYKLIPKLVGFKRDPQFFASVIFEMVVDGSTSFFGAKKVATPSEADEVNDLIAGMLKI